MLGSPQDLTDPMQLTDWLELRATVTADRNSSLADLHSILQTAGVEADTDATNEDLLDSVVAELEERTTAAGTGYPFEFNQNVLTYTENNDHVYLFCLLLSYLGFEKSKANFPRIAVAFEEIARDAMKHYIGGNAVRFGSPRIAAELPSGFRLALAKVCQLVGEGTGATTEKIHHSKDGGLDIVAWRPFSDKLSGKLLIFGQCACGSNWMSKTAELQPEAFIRKFVANGFSSTPIRAFCVPFVVDRNRWDHLTIDAGIIFDRLRLAAFSAEHTPSGDATAWINSQLKSMHL